jgi:hypothetical protein
MSREYFETFPEEPRMLTLGQLRDKIDKIIQEEERWKDVYVGLHLESKFVRIAAFDTNRGKSYDLLKFDLI